MSLSDPLVSSPEVHPFHTDPGQISGSVRQRGFCFSPGRELLRSFCGPSVASSSRGCRSSLQELNNKTVLPQRLLPSLHVSVAVSFAVVGASVLFSC